MDASIHDWLEGRGEEVVLITMIDDATSRVMARFVTLQGSELLFSGNGGSVPVAV